MCSLYTNIPQEDGINVVCQYYEEHYQSKQPIPVTHLGELMRPILKENSFKFHDKHFLQTHGIAMGTKMAVAFAVIFMVHIEKQLLAASPQKPLFWKRFIDDIFSMPLEAQSKAQMISTIAKCNVPGRCSDLFIGIYCCSHDNLSC